MSIVRYLCVTFFHIQATSAVQICLIVECFVCRQRKSRPVISGGDSFSGVRLKPKLQMRFLRVNGTILQDSGQNESLHMLLATISLVSILKLINDRCERSWFFLVNLNTRKVSGLQCICNISRYVCWKLGKMKFPIEWHRVIFCA